MLICTPLYAEVYKWTDEHGNVHYGDRPDQGVVVDEVELEVQTIDSGISGERGEMRERVLEVLKEDREALAEKRKQQRAEAKRRKQQCERARNKYNRLKYARGVFKRDKDGDRNFYSAEKRQRVEEKYRKAIKRHCG